ncbi:MAG: hypothetical protein P8Y07_06875 [Gemmatimonadales bacterium]
MSLVRIARFVSDCRKRPPGGREEDRSAGDAIPEPVVRRRYAEVAAELAGQMDAVHARVGGNVGKMRRFAKALPSMKQPTRRVSGTRDSRAD